MVSKICLGSFVLFGRLLSGSHLANGCHSVLGCISVLLGGIFESGWSVV